MDRIRSENTIHDPATIAQFNAQLMGSAPFSPRQLDAAAAAVGFRMAEWQHVMPDGLQRGYINAEGRCVIAGQAGFNTGWRWRQPITVG